MPRYIQRTVLMQEYFNSEVKLPYKLTIELESADWNFSGRKETSRRTITASINRRGMETLRANPIYRHPNYAVGMRHRRS